MSSRALHALVFAGGVALAAMAGAAAAGGRHGMALALFAALAAALAITARAEGRARKADAAARQGLSRLLETRTGELEQRSHELACKMKELEAARTHLGVTERLASVGRLASGVAHEINSPLAVVMTNVAWLRETLQGHLAPGRDLPPGPPPEEFFAALTESERAGQRMASIVRDLLSFAQDRAGTAGTSDLVTVLQHVQRLVAHEVRARARLELEVPGSPVLVAGSSACLGQLFAHLLLYAAHDIEEGAAEKNEVRVVVRAEDGGAWVVVSDTGRGLAPEALAHVFDPFYAAWNGDGAASGLGLGVCHGIARALGGDIDIESTLGHGSVYRVRLPGAASESRFALGPREASRPRVLVVDDEPLVCASLYRVLSRDFDVVPHTSAHHAISLVRAGERFDAVLCDLAMPEMSGIDFYEELSRLRPRLASEVVFLSGGAFTNTSQEFLHGVSNVCIQKPFEPAGLISLLAERCRPGLASAQTTPAGASAGGTRWHA